MKIATFSVLVLSLALAACGQGIEGSFGGDAPGLKGAVLTFKPNGKAIYMGVAEMDYKVNGKQITLHSPQGVIVVMARDDGSLDFPILGNLKKVPS